jgi:hypothetical protein
MKLAFLALALSLSLTLSSVGQITAFPIPTTKISELTARTIEAGDTTVVVDSGALGNYKVDLGDEIVALRAAIVLGSTDLELAALAALLTAHEALLTNPHAVTAAQTGAETTAQLDARDTATALLTSNHAALVNNPHSVTKAQVGLTNVDDTSDANKPVSTAGASALALKADADDVATFEARVDNPHAVTKAQVGLTNADNTSDVNKPISTATQSALTSDATALSDHEALVNNPHAVTKTQVGLSNVDNTTDLLKPLSTAEIAALALKSPLAGPLFTGNVGIGTATPSVALEIKTAGATTAGLRLTDGNNRYAELRKTSSNNAIELFNSYSNKIILGATESGVFTYLMSGNVGIGTTTPDGLLHGLKTGTFDPVLGGSSSNSSLMFENGDGTDVGLYNGINWLRRNSTTLNGAFVSAYNADASANTGLALGTHGATAMLIDNAGNVGIGTTTPGSPLTVYANPGAVATPVAWLHNSGNFADYDGVVISSVNNGSDAEVLHVRANNTTYSEGTSLMLVRGDGNVGIGTATPNSPLEISKSAAGANVDLLTLNNPSATVGSATKIILRSTGSTVRNAYIQAINTSSSGAPQDLTFGTNAAYADGTEKMRITATGNVGIGTTTPAVALDVVGAIATNDSASTLATAATTLAVTSNFATVTGAAGGNTVATITGGVTGMRVTLLFVDALVTITDTAAATANTVNLSAAFTSSANDTMELIHNGTKWFEVSRSVN